MNKVEKSKLFPTLWESDTKDQFIFSVSDISLVEDKKKDLLLVLDASGLSDIFGEGRTYEEALRKFRENFEEWFKGIEAFRNQLMTEDNPTPVYVDYMNMSLSKEFQHISVMNELKERNKQWEQEHKDK